MQKKRPTNYLNHVNINQSPPNMIWIYTFQFYLLPSGHKEIMKNLLWDL